MSRVKIAIVSGSRAEFGQLLPLLIKLEDDDYFDLQFIVTGSHLSPSRGNTISEIENYPIKISKCIPIPSIDDNTQRGIAKQISEVINAFSDYFLQSKPDLMLVIGDRYEIFAVGITANILLIPIIHICGGSTTSGAIDETYRHSLSKMAKYHFVTCDEYRKRVIQLGEQPQNVFNVGSLAIENCLKMTIATEDELRNCIGLKKDEKYCVVTFHPVTLEKDASDNEMNELISALDSFKDYSYIITLSNTDSGGNRINELWIEAAKSRSNYYVVPSLGIRRYLTALKYSEMMIGNSSSGTTEGPAMHIPTIDIGDRQKGRLFAKSLIHCEPEKNSIVEAIEKANSKQFREMLKTVSNPFGAGDTSTKIVKILKKITQKDIELKKDFYDVNFEVTR